MQNKKLEAALQNLQDSLPSLRNESRKMDDRVEEAERLIHEKELVIARLRVELNEGETGLYAGSKVLIKLKNELSALDSSIRVSKKEVAAIQDGSRPLEAKYSKLSTKLRAFVSAFNSTQNRFISILKEKKILLELNGVELAREKSKLASLNEKIDAISRANADLVSLRQRALTLRIQSNDAELHADSIFKLLNETRRALKLSRDVMETSDSIPSVKNVLTQRVSNLAERVNELNTEYDDATESVKKFAFELVEVNKALAVLKLEDASDLKQEVEHVNERIIHLDKLLTELTSLIVSYEKTLSSHEKISNLLSIVITPTVVRAVPLETVESVDQSQSGVGDDVDHESLSLLKQTIETLEEQIAGLSADDDLIEVLKTHVGALKQSLAE